MERLVSAVVVLLIAFGLISSCVFVVDQRQFAVVFALGQIKEVVSKAGLHFKLPPPFQNVQYFDKRILTIDTPDAERVQTSEKKNLLVDSFVKWRIADPRLYFVTFGGVERAAQERLTTIIRDALNASINRRTVNDVTSRERDIIMQEIRQNVASIAKGFGVQIVDVRLKRVDFAPEISESVYRRMEAERKRVANEQRSIGGAAAEKIRADADRQREVTLAEAYSKAQAIKGEGDAQASAVYAQAFGQDREFFNFYRAMNAYKASFQSKSDVFVVDPSSEFFRFFRNSASSGAAK